MNENLQPDADLVRDFAQATQASKGKPVIGPEQGATIMTAMREVDKLSMSLAEVTRELCLVQGEVEANRKERKQLAELARECKGSKYSGVWEWWEYGVLTTGDLHDMHQYQDKLQNKSTMLINAICRLLDKKEKLEVQKTVLEQRVQAYNKIVFEITGVDLSAFSSPQHE